jgi:hypothetical protein
VKDRRQNNITFALGQLKKGWQKLFFMSLHVFSQHNFEIQHRPLEQIYNLIDSARLD